MKHPFNYLVLFAVLLSTLSCNRSSVNKDALTKAKDERYLIPGFPSARFWLRTNSSMPLVSAHRGQPELKGFPENSLLSVEKLVSTGSYVLELDVAESSDGVLFLFHDDDLDRLTVHNGPVSALPWSALDTMRLFDKQGRLTKETIPTLSEALALAKGKALITLDRKQDVPFTKLWQAIKKAEMQNDVALILYDQEDYREWAEMDELGPISYAATNLLIFEQLAQRNRELYSRLGVEPFKSRERQPALGFAGVGRPDQAILDRAKTLNIKTIVGTFGELDQLAEKTAGKTYRDLVDAGVSIIATNRPIAAQKAIARYQLSPAP